MNVSQHMITLGGIVISFNDLNHLTIETNELFGYMVVGETEKHGKFQITNGTLEHCYESYSKIIARFVGDDLDFYQHNIEK